jgi:hypothetical protein
VLHLVWSDSSPILIPTCVHENNTCVPGYRIPFLHQSLQLYYPSAYASTTWQDIGLHTSDWGAREWVSILSRWLVWWWCDGGQRGLQFSCRVRTTVGAWWQKKKK